MQNFQPDPANAVSSQEAQEILATWADRRKAQGVDPNLGSVSALAAGMGVSEDEVRQMLEDIRVHKRSKELAAGIVDEQLKHRKRSDVNAAIIAAVVVIVLVLGGLAFVLFRPHSQPPAAIDLTTQINDEVNRNIREIKIPPIPHVTIGEGDSAIYNDGKGNVINITDDTLIVKEQGVVTNLSGQPAIDECKQRIADLQKQIEDLKSKKNLSPTEQAQVDDLSKRLTTYQHGIKILENAKSTPPGTPAPAAPSAR